MIISKLFDFYYNYPNCIPHNWGTLAAEITGSERAIIVCDFIAGMTDNYAIKEYNSAFDPNDKLLIL
jgi:dGTPase